MGAGKTHIGRRVAEELGVPFIDTDERIVDAYGPIAEIFARDGEDRFRVMEREAVAEALRTRAVVSLGGGAVLDRATQEQLAGCRVVYLTVTTEGVRNRIRGDSRPLLRTGIEDWQRLYDQRKPLYEALATIRIDTSDRSVDAIVSDIVTWARRKS
ncbi:MAG: shikimate kinase [Cryobacterium sp.]|jgi:shikimate kinase|nr:shikimate kinase [Cryobacterium sp.]